MAQGFGSSEVNMSRPGQLEDLTRQLEEVEKDRAALHTTFAQKTEEHAQKFGDICTGFEEQVKSLEGDLIRARKEVESLREDKVRLESLQSKESQGEREVELRKQVEEARVELTIAREEAQARSNEVESMKKRNQESHETLLELLRKAELAQSQLAEVEEKLGAATSDLEELRTKADGKGQPRQFDIPEDSEGDITHGLESINAQLEEELVQQDKEIQELSDKVAELQADLDAVLDEREADEGLRDDLDRLNQVVGELEEELKEKDADLEALRGKSALIKSINSTGQDSGAVEEMEKQLDEAFREIGRLKHEIASTSHRKSVIDMRDMRIQSLEREKAVLQERLANTRDGSVVPGMKTVASPFKSTPLARKGLISMKHLTPGPLMEVSLKSPS